MDTTRILLADSDTGFVNDLAAYLNTKGYTSLTVEYDCSMIRTDTILQYDCAVIELCDMMACGVPLVKGTPLTSVILTCRNHTLEAELLARSLRPSVYLVKPVPAIDVFTVILRILEIRERAHLVYGQRLYGSMQEGI